MNSDYAGERTHEAAAEQYLTTPFVDIYETQEEYVVLADIPGVKKENLDITVENGVLTLQGDVEREKPDGSDTYSEYGIHGYQRRFNISDDINAAGINANVENGVLTLHLPKREELKPRKIEITTH